LLGWTAERVCVQAGIPLLVESSIKRALDIDWNEAGEKAEAIKTFARQLDALQSWIARRLPEEVATPPLKKHLEALVQIRTQDLEPDPRRAGPRIREGVAEIDASRLRIRTCVTAGRARVSGSMASSGISRRMSIGG
jgi:hypothetical protein